MGLLDTLLGRTRPVAPALDVLFAVPSAGYTLQAALGLASTGVGAVCFKAAEGAAVQQARAELRALPALGHTTGVSVRGDEYGFTWITCRQSTVDLPALVTQLHGVSTTLTDAGFGPALLCTSIGFAAPKPDRDRRLGLIYLFTRGTCYPFAPHPGGSRDIALELQVRAELSGELPIEPDLSRWFPTWNAPVP
jgi:hypothetical protein